MKPQMRFFLSVSIILGLLALLPAQAVQEGGGWVCPPCGHAEHPVFEQPGSCPVCGMKLVTEAEARRLEEEAKRRAANRKKVAILIFDGVQIIDFTGPYEVFGQAGFQVFTVAEKSQSITTSMGLDVNPKFNFEDNPAPDIVLVPGGSIAAALNSPRAIEWLKQQVENAEYVLSVCNGAFILAETGLLDGRVATTFYGLLDKFAADYPQVKVVRDQRYTDNGKFLTSAGLSSGIDASLYLVSRVLGRARAQQVALHMEYQWDPESDFARAALADRYLPDMDFPPGIRGRLLNTGGDRDHWEVSYRIESDQSASEVMRRLRERLGKDSSWTLQSLPGDDSVQSWWTFSPEPGEKWKAVCTIKPSAEEKVWQATLRLERQN